jgi:hypothetical protein
MMGTATSAAFSWDGRERAVHLGNVAEYNDQFLGAPMSGEARQRWCTDCHHYANLALFYSPHPAVVVLPVHVDRSWSELVARQLEWDPVDVYSGITTDASLCEAIVRRPALLARTSGKPLLPWGRTRAFENMEAGVGEPSGALVATRQFESKAATNTLFADLAQGRPGVVVPWQRFAHTFRRTAQAISTAVAAGESIVLKAERGVGGQGTAVITPQMVGAAGGATKLIRRILPGDWFRRHGSILVEQYVEDGAELKDLTFDAVVDDSGEVRTVGTGAMIIDGTRYRGVTIGAGVVPAPLDEVVHEFGQAVGRALSAYGYRGWFDVDFVADRLGRVAPTEVYARHTGPTVAFSIQARLDQIRGGAHVVRTLDRLSLRARLPEEALFEHMRRLRCDCATLGVLLVTTVPTASFEPVPYVGVALAARSVASLDSAEKLIRRANAALAYIFDGPRTAS